VHPKCIQKPVFSFLITTHHQLHLLLGRFLFFAIDSINVPQKLSRCPCLSGVNCSPMLCWHPICPCTPKTPASAGFPLPTNNNSIHLAFLFLEKVQAGIVVGLLRIKSLYNCRARFLAFLISTWIKNLFRRGIIADSFSCICHLGEKF